MKYNLFLQSAGQKFETEFENCLSGSSLNKTCRFLRKRNLGRAIVIRVTGEMGFQSKTISFLLKPTDIAKFETEEYGKESSLTNQKRICVVSNLAMISDFVDNSIALLFPEEKPFDEEIEWEVC